MLYNSNMSETTQGHMERRPQDKRTKPVIIDELPRRSHVEPRSRSRRNLLIAGGASAAVAGTATAMGLTDAALNLAAGFLDKLRRQGVEGVLPREVAQAETLPDAIQDGKYTLFLDKGTLRLDPNHLDVIKKDKSGHDYNVNIVHLNQVVSLNGEKLNGRTTLEADTPEIAYGYNPDDVIAGHGAWIRFRAVGILDLEKPLTRTETYVYFNISNQTKNSFRNDKAGAIHKVDKEQDGKIYTKDNRAPFYKSDVGRITFP